MFLLSSFALAAGWNELRTDTVRASSFLQSNWNKYQENYHPSYAFDDDPRTGWVEGVDGDGVGEWIEWEVSPIASARGVKLVISNGYQKSDSLLAANAAPKDVHVALLDIRGKEVGAVDATLQRAMGTQEVTIPAQGAFRAVRLTVRSAWPGKTYKDLVISDLRLMVDSDTPYKAAVEAQKLATLKAWIAERVNTAKYFASLPPTYPFRSTKASSAPSAQAQPALCGAVLGALRPVLAQFATEKTWYQARLPAAQPVPDGYWSDLPTGWLDSGGITLFEATKDVAATDKRNGEEMWWQVTRGNVHVQWADAGHTRPKAIYYWERHVGEEREAYDYKEEWLLVYDDAGHLVRRYRTHGEAPVIGEGDLLEEYAWENGKVTRVTSTSGSPTGQDAYCYVDETRF